MTMQAKENQSVTAQTVVVILAAGKGSRMGAGDTAKVCFEIDGMPAVNRTLHTFRRLGFERFMLVVGSHAEQVQQTVNAEHGDAGVVYVYQEPQLGTGHAARIAAQSLSAMGHEGYVLVTMGDKFIEPDAIEALRDGFIRQNADLALLSIPRTKATEGSGGRIFIDESGQALDIIETSDLARRAIADAVKTRLKAGRSLSAQMLETLIRRYLPSEKKQRLAVPELLEIARGGKQPNPQKLRALADSEKYLLRIAGKAYTAAEIESRCKSLNPSLYLFKTEAFYTGVSGLTNDNAQGEYYLTDVVKHLSAQSESQAHSRKVRVVPIRNPEWIQGFNSPDELLAIQDYLQRKKKKKTRTGPVYTVDLGKNRYAPVSQWLERIEKNPPSMKKWLNRIYGDHPDLHEKKRGQLLSVLKCYGRRFGFDQKVVIVRSPGRVNLMGRHVDHRGGYNNFLAIHRETFAVTGLREDDNVVAVNVDSRSFKPVRFNIAELIGRFLWSDWLNFINSDWVRQMLRSAQGDWGNYIKAAVLRLQHEYQDIRLRGINMAVLGDVPIAAGLSSSSTIVVTTLQAAIALNGLELTTRQFIDLCGQGEWFVGSRGGAGDHAAIYIGQRGKIANVGFLPFKIETMIPAPEEYQVVIVNSHTRAAKSAGARNIFNAKVCSYNLGFELIRLRCPEIANRIEHLRDVNPEHLACRISDIYRILKKIPQAMTRKEIREALTGSHADLLDTNFASHKDPGLYPLRGVLMFGIAEIVRSRLCINLLQEEKIEEFGRLMNISHDGDRVRCPDGRAVNDWYDNAYLDRLISDLAAESPDRVLNAQLYMQPGCYGCSTPDIDNIVDIANSVPGVAGAQIAGAGLGGCVIVLTRKQAVEQLAREITRRFYRPRKLKPDIIPCITVDGSGLVRF